MFKKNQPNWNFSINFVMYSCIAIRAGTDGILGMEQFGKMVNGLSCGLFSLGCLISSSCTTPSEMELFVKVYGF